MILSAIRSLLAWPLSLVPTVRRTGNDVPVHAAVRIRHRCAYSRQEGAAAQRRPRRHPLTGPPGITEGRGRMPEPTTASPPATSVPPAELPASLREAGLA